MRLKAQQNHFVYLQTENKQPFYAKLDKKRYSSSTSGYLIIPKLINGVYTITLGFAKNEWPEQSITFSIDKKDVGYILKNFGDKGWGLFNWQTMNVVMANKENLQLESKNNQPVVSTPTPVVQAPIKNANTQIENTEEVKPLSVVTKLLSNKSSDGIEMIFVDANNNKSDTIIVFIPYKKEQPETDIKNGELVKEDKPSVVQQKPTSGIGEVKPIEKKQEVAQEKQVTAIDKFVVTDKQVIKNSTCKAFAIEDDFLKLRKKMAAEDNDDDMVHTAVKTFKLKCFTTEQIKNLSVLFLNDAGRYKFLDAAYPYVSDSNNYYLLASLLKDEYYINRFSALMRQ